MILPPKHMNACPLTDKKFFEVVGNPDYIIEEKLKGIRASVRFGEHSNLITSRGGHDISHRFPHIANALYPHLLDVILDGELYQRGVEDEVIAGWGNCRTKNIDPSATAKVKFYYFDVLNNDNISQLSRKVSLEVLRANLYPPFIMLSWGKQISSVETLKYYKSIIDSGGEGIMLKNVNSHYFPSKRPQNVWYKMKKSETFDVIITGFEMAEKFSVKKGDIEATKTKFAGLIGAFKYGMYVSPDDPCCCGQPQKPHYPCEVEFCEDMNLKTLGTCSGMDDITRFDMTNHPDVWLGKVVEIEGVEQKASGAIDNPRFKCIRHDKKPEECIWRM